MLIRDGCTQWLSPDWPAHKRVVGVVSTRSGNLSAAPYDGFNTASHVGAQVSDVERCRHYFQQRFKIAQSPQWLDQVHGTEVVEAQADGLVRKGDGCFTQQSGVICTLHTADCLPVFFSDINGEQVALAHAGWRGLAAGILETTLASFSDASGVICWLGPAISQPHFEVGAEVKEAFESSQSCHSSAFVSSGRVSEGGEHFLCDLYSLARSRLKDHGVEQVFGGDYCTYSDPRFFSYRRQATTGRILSALWVDPLF
ncbi:MAG: peptidoglycan editing factor PgeF [Pseudomonadales bacterium]|nr:peptidoglycan editing factor PgeF [Pseudomonadales bacterium]